MDNNCFEEFLFGNHPEYYYTAIKEMVKFLKKDESEIKKLLSVNIRSLA
jgi:hypothetical protein